MKNMSKIKAIKTILVIFLILGLVCGCEKIPQNQEEMNKDSNVKEEQDAWEIARTTPLGKYPELVTYTLGKVIGANNSNMPEGDTYEDNNYTRYLRGLLNVQNEDVIEGLNNIQYERMEKMAISEKELPDIMIVTSPEILDVLVENDMIEDLTEVYETCATDRIKEMYESYGDDKLEAVTYDGKLMAFPETEVYTGPQLLWMRKDWIDKLGLNEPQTMEEAMDIVQRFVEDNPGASPEGNVGLVFDPSMVGQSDRCFALDPIFDEYGAYPGKWIKSGDGNMVNGSVTEESRNALEMLAGLYQRGILDQNFMLRTAENLPELLEDNQCGAFFGWWWAPNNPLAVIYDEEAEWKPYLFTAEDGRIETSLSYGRQYSIVAKKGFEYPEIIPKILSALFDYARYDGKDEAKGVGEYLGTNVDPTATPFVINLDYSDAIFRVTDNLRNVIEGKKSYKDLTVLEQGYYNSCAGYMDGGMNEAYEWAAYTSRLTAVSKLAEAEIHYVNEGYTQKFDLLTSDELEELTTKTYIMIITGEKPIEYFDTYVKEWYENGGQELTEEANHIVEEQ